MLRFVDIVARTIPAMRLKEMAGILALSEDETYLLLERCAKQKSIDQCDRMQRRKQSEIMRALDAKVTTWVLLQVEEWEDNTPSFFSEREQKALLKAIDKWNKPA